MSTPDPTTDTPAIATKPRSRGLLYGAVAVLLMVAGGVAWYVLQPPAETPADRLQAGLKALAAGRTFDCREIAERMIAEQERPAFFPGGPHFLLGMLAFQAAEDSVEPFTQKYLQTAVDELRTADQQGVAAEYELTLVSGLGRSLFRLGSVRESRLLLEQAWYAEAEGRAEIADMLVEMYLDPSVATDELLALAAELNDFLVTDIAEDSARLARQRLRKAEIRMAQKQWTQARELLEQLAGDAAAVDVLEDSLPLAMSRLELAEGQHERALATIAPILQADRRDRSTTRRAFYLAGLIVMDRVQGIPVEQSQNDRRLAGSYWLSAINRGERSPEAVAAWLNLGELLDADQNIEKSLQALRTGLSVSGRPEEFRNRWLSLKDYRQRLSAIWNRWIEAGLFNDAIALAEQLAPIVPREDAAAMAAQGYRRTAETLDAELSSQRLSVQQQRRPELRRAWKASGDAFAEMARYRGHTADYPEALWTSALHYTKARQLELALAQTKAFLETMPSEKLAAGRLAKAQILLDLDRPDESLAELLTVLREQPTDPLVFRARLMLADVHWDAGRSEQAEVAYRELVNSPSLTPLANEWRDGSLGLARLLVERAAVDKRGLERSFVGTGSLSPQELALQVSQRLTEAGTRLNEYIERYPDSPDLMTARSLLARCLVYRAELLDREIKAAETRDSRRMLREEKASLLTQCLAQQRILRDELNVGLRQDQLNPSQLELLRSLTFEIPHHLLTLEQYSEALSGFVTAINRYPQDPRCLSTLVEMSRCERAVGHLPEARSLLDQARVALQSEQFPADQFSSQITSLTRDEWVAWIDRLIQAGR